MTEREALKLALEALKQIDEAMPFPVAKLAIMEAEKALAQPEQEPVAVVAEVHMSRYTIEWTNGPLPEDTKLYTTPPQCTWVGLTDDEIDQGLLRSDYAFKTAEAWRAGVVFAMTKLKQKNGYDS
jgi:hypothetical protein